MVAMCARDGCNKIAKKSCAACGNVNYCCALCQKAHWKIFHRNRCLRILPSELLPVADILNILRTLSDQLKRLNLIDDTTDDQISALKHAIAFAELQFVIPTVPGLYYYCSRKDGSQIDNLTVSLSMTSLYFNLGTRYSNQQSMKAAAHAELFYKKSRSILEPLLILLDSPSEVDAIYDVISRKENILSQLSKSEKKLAINCMELKRFKESDYHCQQSLKFARRMIEGNFETTTVLFEALLCFGEFRGHQYLKDCDSNSKGACDYFEEAYILVSEAYGPVHPQVQEVSVHLIGSLCKLGDFEEAERFARINYESLTALDSGINRNDRRVMKGASMLVKISYMMAQQRRTPLVKFKEAEELARMVIRIAIETDGEEGYDAGIYQFDLYQILNVHSKLYGHTMSEIALRESAAEREFLLNRSRAVAVRCHGTECKNVMYLDQELHLLYQERMSSLPDGVDRVEAKFKSSAYQNSALRVSMKLNGVVHPYTLELLSKFATFDFLEFRRYFKSFLSLMLVLSIAFCVFRFVLTSRRVSFV